MNGQTCAAPGCDNPVDRRPGQRGRPAIYCSLACRPSRQGNAGAITVDVGQDDDNAAGGRTWMVTLRRGRRRVVVGRDLGRFSAAMLSRELRALLHPRTRQEGDAIE